ncbi:hypothetical protein [Rahnella aquatilis]|uniref:Uncharacterized protein n=1 Tax=Rahnella aquatilis (strain ATCC 33071 / DSM 4594 / JCM 1683 / NBRC 105701 / NCIMB 13365 / CIP 78.65) TaxID=745277 RepID=H2IZ64_RAHAC|nr:hypothetical protein [Rahnella aquatilis]AEX50977.1 hypothetical protein Rahaq2_1087 [Rahnella aquatilis CIP 78.65 = ATCC 33071]KFD18574.1 hypothetical protein GRAQ_00125 [Rahnella aquatilis CIP 78.65 = ATCC 33071]
MPFFKKKNSKPIPEELQLTEQENKKTRDMQRAATLQSWAVLPENHVLVHTFQLHISPFCHQNAASLLNSWDIFSASLIDLKDIKPLTSATSRYTGMFHNVALVLEVPRQNILGTFPHDVWFINHAGRKDYSPTGPVIRPYELVDCIRSGRGVENYKCAGGYQQLLTPTRLMIKDKIFRKDHSHNEILVIGKSGLNLYAGLPPTQPIRVTKVLAVDKTLFPNHGNVHFDQMKTAEEIGKYVARLNNVPFEIL